MNTALKKIVPRGLLLLLPFFLYYICYLEYLIIEGKFENDASLVYKALDKSHRKVKKQKKKIIVGDSMASQLFSPYQDADSVYSLCTTGPAQVMGVYIVLQNFVAINDNQDKDFYYIVHPHSLYCQIKTKYAYNHFVKPFYTLSNCQYFTPSLNDSIQQIPYWYAAQLPFIKISDFEPVYNYTSDTSGSLPPLNIEYLKLINESVKKNHLKFHVLMPFLNEILKGEDYTNLKAVIEENGLDDIFSDYFKDIKYLPSSEFKADKGHYNNVEKVRTYPFKI